MIVKDGRHEAQMLLYCSNELGTIRCPEDVYFKHISVTATVPHVTHCCQRLDLRPCVKLIVLHFAMSVTLGDPKVYS